MYAPLGVLSERDIACATGTINAADGSSAKLQLNDCEIYIGDLCGNKILSKTNLMETEGPANALACGSKIIVSVPSKPGASCSAYVEEQARLVALVVGTKLHSAKLDVLSKTEFVHYNYGVRFPVGMAFFKVSRPEIMDYAFQFIERNKPEDNQGLSILLGCSDADVSSIEQTDARLADIAFDQNCSGAPFPDMNVQVLGLQL